MAPKRELTVAGIYLPPAGSDLPLNLHERKTRMQETSNHNVNHLTSYVNTNAFSMSATKVFDLMIQSLLLLKMGKMKQTDGYYKMVEEIDQKVEQLSTLHINKMQCKAGCAQCCLNFDVFPIEFYAIKDKMEADNFQIPNLVSNDEESCLFLKNNLCQIYPYRPIICRTHGLPLLAMNETAEFWELSHCELNFEDVQPDFFHQDNSLIMDKFNSELFQQNMAFLEANSLDYDKFQLLPLKLLIPKN